MNTLPLAVILQQPFPEIEQSQTEHSFPPFHFSKQILLIPEKPLQDATTQNVQHVNDVQHIRKQQILWTFVAVIRHSWPHLGRDFKVLLSIHLKATSKRG